MNVKYNSLVHERYEGRGFESGVENSYLKDGLTACLFEHFFNFSVQIKCLLATGDFV